MIWQLFLLKITLDQREHSYVDELFTLDIIPIFLHVLE